MISPKSNSMAIKYHAIFFIFIFDCLIWLPVLLSNIIWEKETQFGERIFSVELNAIRFFFVLSIFTDIHWCIVEGLRCYGFLTTSTSTQFQRKENSMISFLQDLRYFFFNKTNSISLVLRFDLSRNVTFCTTFTVNSDVKSFSTSGSRSAFIEFYKITIYNHVTSCTIFNSLKRVKLMNWPTK